MNLNARFYINMQYVVKDTDNYKGKKTLKI